MWSFNGTILGADEKTSDGADEVTNEIFGYDEGLSDGAMKQEGRQIEVQIDLHL